MSTCARVSTSSSTARRALNVSQDISVNSLNPVRSMFSRETLRRSGPCFVVPPSSLSLLPWVETGSAPGTTPQRASPPTLILWN